MPKELTPKQESFCQAIISGKNYTESYKIAYTPKTTNVNSLNRIAFKVYHDVKIQSRINELKEKIESKLIYTAQQSFKKLEEIQNLALQQKKKIYIKDVSMPIEEESPDLQNAIKAEELKGKLANLYTDKSKIEIKGNIQLNFDAEDKNA